MLFSDNGFKLGKATNSPLHSSAWRHANSRAIIIRFMPPPGFSPGHSAFNQSNLQNHDADLSHALPQSPQPKTTAHPLSGEHGAWSKMDLLDLSSRIPFIIRAPWIQESAGVRDSTVVELVDVFRTAADLAGIPVTKEEEGTRGYYGLAGRSLVPLLKRLPAASAPRRAFTQFPRCATQEGFPRHWPGGPFKTSKAKGKYGLVFVCMHIPKEQFTAMGYAGECAWAASHLSLESTPAADTSDSVRCIPSCTVRSNSFRYVEWRKWIPDQLRSDWTSAGLLDSELYE